MPIMKTLTIGGTTYDLEGGVTSVNGQTGDVVLDADDVGAATEQDIADAIIQVLPVDSASGAVASFPDGYPAPVEALTAAITPVQDLHGQTSPYPAGGGKNKLEKIVETVQTVNDITFTPLEDGYVRVQGTATATATTAFHYVSLPAGTYTVSSNASAGDTVTGVQVNGSNVARSGQSVTFEHSGGNMTVRCRVSSGITLNEVWRCQIESGSTATTYAPYSNLCPISGWSEAAVTRTGSNLLSTPLSYSSSGALSKSNSVFLKAGTYTVGFDSVSVGSTWRFFAKCFKEDGSVLYTGNELTGLPARDSLSGYLNDGNTQDKTVTITLPKDTYIAFAMMFGTITAESVFTGSRLNVGSTATAYESPNIQTVTIDLSGTRYGGTLDVLTGVLTVTHKMTTINNLDWTIASSCFISIGSSTTPGKAGSVGSDNPIICSAYATKATRGYASSYAEKQCGLSVDGTQIIIKDTTYATESALKTAMGTQTLVYELATPTTVQLTSAELETILGQNNIWANCGDVAVSYRADIQRYIQKLMS